MLWLGNVDVGGALGERGGPCFWRGAEVFSSYACFEIRLVAEPFPEEAVLKSTVYPPLLNHPVGSGAGAAGPGRGSATSKIQFCRGLARV